MCDHVTISVIEASDAVETSRDKSIPTVYTVFYFNRKTHAKSNPLSWIKDDLVIFEGVYG